MIVQCKNCGKSCRTYPGRVKSAKNKFCSIRCSSKWMFAPCRNPLRGRILIKDDRIRFIDKNGIIRRGYTRNCLKCGSSFIALDFMVKHGKGTFCSYKCSALSRDNLAFLRKAHLRGKLHSSYIHGKGYGNKNKRKMEMASSAYRSWRRDVLKRDNFMCKDCLSKERLIVHHIKPWKDYPGLRYEISNGKVLCWECHKKHHSELRIIKIVRSEI